MGLSGVLQCIIATLCAVHEVSCRRCFGLASQGLIAKLKLVMWDVQSVVSTVLPLGDPTQGRLAPRSLLWLLQGPC